MGALEQLESFLQELLERPAWLLGARNPRLVELASALTRELEAKAISLPDRILIPSDYTIRMAGADLSRLTATLNDFERELADYVQRLALERDLSLSGRPVVRIRPGDAMQPGEIEVAALFPIRTGRPDAERQRRAGVSLTLLSAEGDEVRRYDLDGPAISLGRQADNDIALPDSKISRHHARVDLVGGRYYLVDLDSTNGTRVNGSPIDGRTPLAAGDLIELGLQRLRFSNGRS